MPTCRNTVKKVLGFVYLERAKEGGKALRGMTAITRDTISPGETKEIAQKFLDHVGARQFIKDGWLVVEGAAPVSDEADADPRDNMTPSEKAADTRSRNAAAAEAGE